MIKSNYSCLIYNQYLLVVVWWLKHAISAGIGEIITYNVNGADLATKWYRQLVWIVDKTLRFVYTYGTNICDFHADTCHPGRYSQRDRHRQLCRIKSVKSTYLNGCFLTSQLCTWPLIMRFLVIIPQNIGDMTVKTLPFLVWPCMSLYICFYAGGFEA